MSCFRYLPSIIYNVKTNHGIEKGGNYPFVKHETEEKYIHIVYILYECFDIPFNLFF